MYFNNIYQENIYKSIFRNVLIFTISDALSCKIRPFSKFYTNFTLGANDSNSSLFKSFFSFQKRTQFAPILLPFAPLNFVYKTLN